jgi:C-terminal processing protease CtpA/Prc
MLQSAYDSVKLHYYDPAFHGLDWDARFREYETKLKSAASVGAGQMVVAEFLDGLNDSHTYFAPPHQSYDLDYGYVMNLVGDEAFVTHVRPGTDAAAKLKPGDRVVSINAYDIDRDGYSKMEYILNLLAPRSSTELVVRNTAGIERTVTVTSAVHPRRVVHVLTNGNEIGGVDIQQQNDFTWMKQRRVEITDALIWKMPAFFGDDGEIDGLFALARKHAALILDLRGNPGGRVTTLTRMVGNVFERDVPIGTRKARADAKGVGAIARGGNAYAGKVIVLIDSASASAAEIFARVIQLEQRGTVIGDRSAGAVMEALQYQFAVGNDNLRPYAISVTDADLIMKDGKSLERMGVTPDERLLPTAQDLATGRDVVLARALQLAGVRLDAIAAGKLFPFEWRPF